MRRSAINVMPRNVEKSYENAIALLNSRRRDSRPSAPPEAATGAFLLHPTSKIKGKPNLSGMKSWLRHLGHADSDIDSLNVIHVAGTKGKGSTCAFVNSFLVAHGQRTGFPQRVGLYTSPHLKYVHDRIQINSMPLSKDMFAHYVFEVWDNLRDLGTDRPRFLQILVLVAIHTFLTEKVDVAICETHSGGEFDATNVFRQPIATGISAIGMDHVEQLGPSIENIASHKAGIFKTGSPAFSTLQDPLAAAILEDRAVSKGVELEFVNVCDYLPNDVPSLGPSVQKTNASLALALTNALLRQKETSGSGVITADDIHSGALRFSCHGRFHKISQGSQEWFLDGAHNEMSIKVAADWFADSVGQVQSLVTTLPRVLIFSHISERDGVALLESLASTLKSRKIDLTCVIITTYNQRIDGINDVDRCFEPPSTVFSDEIKESYIRMSQSIFPNTPAVFEPTIEGAITIAKTYGESNGVQILITGSLHLVGGALRVLEPLR